jgi:hypothetical protein
MAAGGNSGVGEWFDIEAVTERASGGPGDEAYTPVKVSLQRNHTTGS